jgi:hypothetical protein
MVSIVRSAMIGACLKRGPEMTTTVVSIAGNWE